MIEFAPTMFQVGMEKEVQTEITLLSGSNISTFRPSHLVEEISPYPPLPVIETTSGLYFTVLPFHIAHSSNCKS